MRGLYLVAVRGGHSSSQCASLSLSWPLLLRSTGSRHAGSVVVAHGPSCSAACGIFPDQGSNPCPLHWQADSQPLRHQGSPQIILNDSSWAFFCAFILCFPYTHILYTHFWKPIHGKTFLEHVAELCKSLNQFVIPSKALNQMTRSQLVEKNCCKIILCLI